VLNILKIYKKLMIQTLMIMMAVVLGLATIDLGWVIAEDIAQPPFMILSVEQLLDVFGLFMLVVIGIELLETVMKTYMTEGPPHYEVVLTVAIIAISRKVIILDLEDLDGINLIGIASTILALTFGYYWMKKSKVLKKESLIGVNQEGTPQQSE
jgi:uncharacterized membrane protein (DUF373 family)